MDYFQDAAFSKNNLIPVSTTIRAGNKTPINMLGAFRVTVSGWSSKNEVIGCNSIIYVSDSVTGFLFRLKLLLNF